MYMYMCIYIYMYTYRHAFQGVVKPCRGQGTSWAQSEPDCAGGSRVLPGRCRGKSQVGLPMAAPGKVGHFHRHSQALTVPKKYVDFRGLFLKFQNKNSHKNSFVCSGEFEVIQPF